MQKHLGLFAFLGMLVLVGAGCSAPEGLSADVVHQAVVAEDDDFPIVVTVTNDSAAAQMIDSVNISSGLYEGLLFNDSIPANEGTELDDFGGNEIEFEGLEVAAGGSLDITLDVNAFWPGDYFGSIDICFEGEEAGCLYESTSITIE